MPTDETSRIYVYDVYFIVNETVLASSTQGNCDAYQNFQYKWLGGHFKLSLIKGRIAHVSQFGFRMQNIRIQSN